VKSEFVRLTPHNTLFDFRFRKFRFNLVQSFVISLNRGDLDPFVTRLFCRLCPYPSLRDHGPRFLARRPTPCVSALMIFTDLLENFAGPNHSNAQQSWCSPSKGCCDPRRISRNHPQGRFDKQTIQLFSEIFLLSFFCDVYYPVR